MGGRYLAYRNRVSRHFFKSRVEENGDSWAINIEQ